MKARWWYMRDNHTFRELKGDKKDVTLALAEDFLEGHTYGMLCSQQSDIVVHARGSKSFNEFAEKCMEVMFDE
jgi:hypothetical protein